MIRENLHLRDISCWEMDLEAILHYMKQNFDPESERYDPEIEVEEIYDYEADSWLSWVYKWTIGEAMVK